ncbi:MAG TPA: DUF3828 domain-containing protein [Paraburkholderia sp.]|jgi:hypothetical protein|nr:DUF3828 domain-containing protein [Paraburkholderia sp.]
MNGPNFARLLSAVVIVFGLAFFQTAAAQSTAQSSTPEATVKAFYEWFIKRDAEDRGYPLMDNEILRYVSRKTVDTLRTQYRHNELPGDAEYFTNVQDFDEADWTAHTAVRPAILLDDVALVPVTLGSADKKTNVVFLRKIDGIWKITKVVDTRDYQ